MAEVTFRKNGVAATGPKVIAAFTGRWECLSNFSPAPVLMPDGILYPTAEHAFQAGKTRNPKIRRTIAAYQTPAAAKQAGRRIDLREGWDQIRKPLMLRVVLAKFTQNPGPGECLQATGDALLVEGNTWHDNYWGDCHCGRPACDPAGRNYLGQVLMAARWMLQED